MEKFDYRKYIKDNKFTISKKPDAPLINEHFMMGGMVSSRPINGNPFGTKTVNETIDSSKIKWSTNAKGEKVPNVKAGDSIKHNNKNYTVKSIWASGDITLKAPNGDMVTIKESKESVNEAKTAPVFLADVFARFLIGDRTAALRQLQSMKDDEFGIMETPGTKEYNDQFKKLVDDIHKAIKRNM